MNRFWIIPLILFGLVFIVKGPPRLNHEPWTRFWEETHNAAKPEVSSSKTEVRKIEHMQEDQVELVNPFNPIKYRVQKKIFFNPYSPSNYETVLR